MSDLMEQLAQLARSQVEAERKVEEQELALKRAEAELRNINETLIPELMERLGLEEYRTADGIHVRVREDIRASLTKTHLNEGVRWLREHGHERLIKNVFSLMAGDEADAHEIRRQLTELSLEFSENPSVHPSTLSAWVREQLANGVDIPMDTFSVHRQRVAKVAI